MPEPVLGSRDRCVEFVEGQEFDVPAGELAGQLDVVALGTDRTWQLIVLDEDDGSAQARMEEHFLGPGRRQGTGNHLLRRIVRAEDVDALAAEFIDDVLDPRAADTNAGVPGTADQLTSTPMEP